MAKQFITAVKKEVSFVEDAEAVEGRAGEEEVNYIGGTGFQGSGNQGGNRNSNGKGDDFWEVVKEEKLQEGDFEIGTPDHRLTTPTESTASCNAVKILTHEEFAAKHPHPPSPVNVQIDQHANNNIDRHSEADIDRQRSSPIDRQRPAPIDRRAPITYRV
ncbi:hypothetical protein F2Q68_00004540 [Brassica cretica]|uniref:Uncharacterized protein n=1 Tax=Brassica cretica TaxID=69181 RepID=A0A8S9JK34_BRACR|nr:hypothetical protein F2Q68_00004540 [Brassica cretica]